MNEAGNSLPSFKAPSLPSPPSLPSAPSLPSFKGSLPSFNLFTDGGDIDPRAVALPGQSVIIRHVAEFAPRHGVCINSEFASMLTYNSCCPGALLAIGGGGFLLSKLDPQFDEFIGAGALKVCVCSHNRNMIVGARCLPNTEPGEAIVSEQTPNGDLKN